MIGLFFIGTVVSIIVLSILIYVRKYDCISGSLTYDCTRRD